MTTLVARPDRVRLAGQRHRAMTTAHQRLMILMLLFIVAIVVIGGRTLALAYFDGGRADNRGGSAMIPARADIVDRNGVPLARTIDAYSLRVVPDRVMNDPRRLAADLAAIFPDTSADSFYAKITGKRPTLLRRRALPEQVAAVNALGEVGFEYPRVKERLYPQHTLAAHVLGFTGADHRGVIGVEKAFDERLSDPALRGDPLILSIDSRVQATLESELYTAMVNLEAQGAAGIVLDVNSGEVLGMASLPVFNPNKIVSGSNPARKNAVTYNLYELGSTFKPLTIGKAMDIGVVTSMTRRYDATRPLKVGRFAIHDSHNMGRWLNVPETLIHSSNVVTAQIADEMGQAPLEQLFRSLGFDNRPQIELKERGFPLWPRSWGRLTTMTTSYGHGIAVTPLHLASAYGALVNGGIFYPATLLKTDHPKVPGKRVFSEATSARMRQLLRMIVVDGTGNKADAPGFRVGGKTGSAEKPSAGGYARHSLVSTFVAAFPMDNPRYVVLAMIDEPKGNAYSSGQRTAGWTAAPVVRNVVMRIGPMLGIIPDQKRDVDLSDLTPLLWKPKGEN